MEYLKETAADVAPVVHGRWAHLGGDEQLQRIWREVEALSESVRDGYVSAPDLIRVLREEYEIDIVGG